MLRDCDKYKKGNEDIFYSKRNFNYPDKKISQNIFVETIFSENPVGVHKVWNYIKGHKFNLLKKIVQKLTKYLENKNYVLIIFFFISHT